MRPSNHLDETKSQHKYSREEGYQPAEYKPEDHQYPKATPYGNARDAEHEAQLKRDHEPKTEETKAE